MLNPELINELANLSGMPGTYLDWAGNPVTVLEDNKVPMLEALGFDVSNDKALKKNIESTIVNHWGKTIPEVAVLHENTPFEG